jgi:uncharacterized protein (DUF1501 family)
MATSQTISRRGFLAAASALGAVGAVEAASPSTGRAKSCIVLLLVGGPSQLETWDPKPDAPSVVRGPFGAIATSMAGVRISEHLPRLASAAHRYAIVRSVHQDGPAIHEAGMQLLQTGRLSAAGEHPHFGSVLAQHFGPGRAAPFVILPSTLRNMGINVSHGQGAGTLGRAHEPMVETSFTHQLAQGDRERYGKTAFGDACARSVQLVEAGTRCVVVNMFASVYDRVTWDCHADRQSLSSTLDDYRRTLCPTFDRAFATLLDDLHQRGLLAETLVVAMGELGRTPRLNGNGGRDHWSGCWSIALAGGGVRGGQVIGASDRLASEPVERPVSCPAVLASIYHALGMTGSVGTAPVRQLFG